MLSNYSILTMHRHQNLNGFVSNLRFLKSKIKRMSITKITFELFAIIIYLERVGRPICVAVVLNIRIASILEKQWWTLYYNSSKRGSEMSYHWISLVDITIIPDLLKCGMDAWVCQRSQRHAGRWVAVLLFTVYQVIKLVAGKKKHRRNVAVAPLGETRVKERER